MDTVCIALPTTARLADELARVADRLTPCPLALDGTPPLLRDVLARSDVEVARLSARHRDLANHASSGLRAMASEATAADRWC